jgi:hypothetical protein
MYNSTQLSLKSFIFGLFSGLLLIFFGNDKSKNSNKVIGLFSIFISFMQLIEYFLWKDINCKNGLNMICFKLGPLFNHLQPIILFLLCSLFIESSNILPPEIIIFSIIIYIIYVINKYNDYISNNLKQCIPANEIGHLNWPWKYEFNYTSYFIIMFIVLLNYYKNKNIMVARFISYLLLFISTTKFNKNIDKLWYFMIPGVPLINLFLQKILNIDN